VIPLSSKEPDWAAKVAVALNMIQRGYPYLQLDAEPSDVREGFTFFDTTAHKVKTWDGTTWQAHW